MVCFHGACEGVGRPSSSVPDWPAGSRSCRAVVLTAWVHGTCYGVDQVLKSWQRLLRSVDPDALASVSIGGVDGYCDGWWDACHLSAVFSGLVTVDFLLVLRNSMRDFIGTGVQYRKSLLVGSDVEESDVVLFESMSVLSDAYFCPQFASGFTEVSVSLRHYTPPRYAEKASF
jgi:hypothetical protein